jgi:hypothetical protein
VDEILREMLPEERGRLVETLERYREEAPFLDKRLLWELMRAIEDL